MKPIVSYLLRHLSYQHDQNFAEKPVVHDLLHVFRYLIDSLYYLASSNPYVMSKSNFIVNNHFYIVICEAKHLMNTFLNVLFVLVVWSPQ